MNRITRAVMALLALGSMLSASILVAPAANSRMADETDPAVSYYAVITVTDVDQDGNILAKRKMKTTERALGKPMKITSGAFDKAMAKGSGSGGLPAPSGCRTLTVRNVTTTTLGLVAFKFVTEVGWCWVTRTATTDINHIAAYPKDVDPNYEWRGVINAFTQNLSGGKRVFRQARFKNCPLAYPCIQTYEPINESIVTITGQWSWKTSG